jgi:hypothetical protein
VYCGDYLFIRLTTFSLIWRQGARVQEEFCCKLLKNLQLKVTKHEWASQQRQPTSRRRPHSNRLGGSETKSSALTVNLSIPKRLNDYAVFCPDSWSVGKVRSQNHRNMQTGYLDLEATRMNELADVLRLPIPFPAPSLSLSFNFENGSVVMWVVARGHRHGADFSHIDFSTQQNESD